MMLQLKKDREGNVITFPMTGWGISPVTAMGSLILTIEYVEAPEQFETGERNQLQTILTISKAQELAEELKRAASAILASGTQLH
jgi:ssRNA-specific RNase YbeY (16S rRNA maturation enzyme)